MLRAGEDWEHFIQVKDSEKNRVIFFSKIKTKRLALDSGVQENNEQDIAQLNSNLRYYLCDGDCSKLFNVSDNSEQNTAHLNSYL